MTADQIAEFLLETADESSVLGKKIKTFADRLLLRIYSIQALQSFLSSCSLTWNETRDTAKLQLDFRRFPNEIMPDVLRLLAAPRQPKIYHYIKDGSARIGIELELKPEDFPGESYDYAY